MLADKRPNSVHIQYIVIVLNIAHDTMPVVVV